MHSSTNKRRWSAGIALAAITTMGAGAISLTSASAATPASADQNAFVYTGPWLSDSGSHWAFDPGASAKATIDIAAGGGTITVNGDSNGETGFARVLVDGATPAYVDTYRNVTTHDGSREWLTTPVLAEGRHTVTVISDDLQNASATNDILSVAGVKTSNGSIVVPTAPVTATTASAVISTPSSGTLSVAWSLAVGTDGANGAIISRNGTDTTGYGAYSSPNQPGTSGTVVLNQLTNGTPYAVTVQPTKDGVAVGTPYTATATPTAGTSTPTPTPATTTDASFTYSGTWITVTGTSHEHWSSQVGATATQAFTVGTGGGTISLQAVRDNSNGSVSVALDGGTAVTVSEKGTSTYGATLWTSGQLAAGAHTLVVKVVTADGSITGATLTNGSFTASTGGGTTTPPASGTAPAGVSGTWNQVYGDEFNDNTIDTSKWSKLEGYNTNNVTTRAANVTETGGNAVLTMSDANNGAELSSSRSDGAGVNGYSFPVGDFVEARVQFPGSGNSGCTNWPAFWTSGPNWPTAGEHDIAETLGGKLTAGNYHYGSTSSPQANNGPAPAGSWCGSFHTYGLYRGATSADVYWDGVKVRSYPTSDNGQPQSILLNVGKSGTAVTGDAGALKVDYVRAFHPGTATTPPASGGGTVGAQFQQQYTQDFTTPAALGQFNTVYPNMSGYDGGQDTSKAGTYSNAKTVSVANGIADQYVHTEGSTHYVSAITPPVFGDPWSGQTYGRYEVRFRSDSTDDYKVAWLLWPTSDNWSEGEVDFPEAGLGGDIGGFSHDVTGNPANNAWSVSTGQSMGDWHTAAIEWQPGSLKFILDGVVKQTTNPAAIPTHDMRWVLQTETNLSGQVSNSSSAHVQVDYVKAWKYVG